MEPIQFNWIRATVRLDNSLIHYNNPLLQKDGLHHAHGLQHKVRSANPPDLSQIEVDLRSRHLAYWRQFSAYYPRDLNSKRITHHHWCDLATKDAYVICSPYVLPKCLYLNLPKHIVRSVARFRLRVHTLKVEQATWNDNFSPTCDLCDALGDVQDE
eukprot:1149585-Pelagomonas_calceolata.AAC.1